jgi:hypothetical protein
MRSRILSIILLSIGLPISYISQSKPVKWLKYLCGELYILKMLLECHFWAFIGYISIPFVHYATKRKFRIEQEKMKRLHEKIKKGCY